MKKISFLFLVFSIICGFNFPASASNPLGSFGEAFNDIKVSENYAYVAGGYGLKIYDISTPSSPVLVGSYTTDDSANGVYVSDNTAYISTEWSGLLIIDVSNPSEPTLIGSYNTDGAAIDVYVSGTKAYVADGLAGLLIIDISNLSSPTLLGKYDTDGFAVSFCQ
ncbi:MAG: hypothetical protein A3H37_07825 [Candidatus Schekmanbacteria bacterium RIFCSPLOWO2_02_FULL_38_14]|uniref:LVIVD repeat protein n=1 Tax=Candidatus Schekmanbacteria bacterium RIFCSPLOWO2_12_FULL_38_15 TaxID=1817883 RepID=A0A1F7SHA9_9BACT|nr:MAG: hypothetical protein A3H37_07825 [Candidatus Schekmanbacteria bacterium RIFCSPLOWO2_02_FULL_38_14]OGL53149.1 MAG: hypothetical protein A3G31_12540 [Candidatus Schekmanbacteria bacterium RIFCSPLOWO2_12_FULL_38_15]